MAKEESFRFYSAVRYNAQEMGFLSVQDTGAKTTHIKLCVSGLVSSE